MGDIKLENLDRDTFLKLTKEFADITGTNEALAQTFLQDHNWNLEKSVNAFTDALLNETRQSDCLTSVQEPSKESNTIMFKPESSNCLYDESKVQKLFGRGMTVTTEPPPRMKLITWNLDGLDIHNLKKRTRQVLKLIEEHEPDVVFFQELIPESADYIESKLPMYKCLRGGSKDYFTMTMLRVFTLFYDSHYIVNYPNTVMGRNLLITEAHMGKLKFKLLNTHLESTSEHSVERQNQLKIAFEHCDSITSDYTIIFGGDLNLRDKEVRVPRNFFDLWEFCGSPQQFKYTWDMTKNTNNSSGFGRFKPKFRFDRVYIKFSIPKRVNPKHFALIGSQRVPQTQSFPSDHWGVVILFDLNH